MSGIAHAAVTFHSRQTGKSLRLLHILADCANEQLVIDPAPKREILAALLDLSIRQLRRIFNDLYVSGELTCTRNGRKGVPSAYRINLATSSPFVRAQPDTGHYRQAVTEESQPDTNTGSVSGYPTQPDISAGHAPQSAGQPSPEHVRLTRLEDMVELLADKMTGFMSAYESQPDISGGHQADIKPTQPDIRRTSPSTESAHDPIDPFDPVDPKEGRARQPDNRPKSTPPAPKPQRPQVFSHKNMSAADKRTVAIAEVCGMNPDIAAHRPNLEWAAVQVGEGVSAETIRRKYSPAQVQPESWNWYYDDWRGQKGQQPTPKELVQTILRERISAPKAQHPTGWGANREQLKAAIAAGQKKRVPAAVTA